MVQHNVEVLDLSNRDFDLIDRHLNFLGQILPGLLDIFSFVDVQGA